MRPVCSLFAKLPSSLFNSRTRCGEPPHRSQNFCTVPTPKSPESVNEDKTADTRGSVTVTMGLLWQEYPDVVRGIKLLPLNCI